MNKVDFVYRSSFKVEKTTEKREQELMMLILIDLIDFFIARIIQKKEKVFFMEMRPRQLRSSH